MVVLVQYISLVQFSFLEIGDVIIVARIISISNLPTIYNNSHSPYPIVSRKHINGFLSTLKLIHQSKFFTYLPWRYHGRGIPGTQLSPLSLRYLLIRKASSLIKVSSSCLLPRSRARKCLGGLLILNALHLCSSYYLSLSGKFSASPIIFGRLGDQTGYMRELTRSKIGISRWGRRCQIITQIFTFSYRVDENIGVRDPSLLDFVAERYSISEWCAPAPHMRASAHQNRSTQYQISLGLRRSNARVAARHTRTFPKTNWWIWTKGPSSFRQLGTIDPGARNK